MPKEPTEMQRLIDSLFAEAAAVTRLDAIIRAEALDLSDGVLAIVALLPPGRYSRARLCDQLNSAITAHGYGSAMGTVE
jgi:hypothetical protein